MCGINGIISKEPQIKSKIIQMNRLIRHRGPDDEGFVCINTENSEYKVCSGDDSIESVKNKFNNISEQNLNNFDLILGTRRLSIIDLSENGHQPMADMENKIWISYNGEIYNYIELRNELQTYGFKFKSQSDTEVIINSYLQWGENCVKHFNGMWAFGLWDGYKQLLFLSRDRFGVKPLYFTLSQNYFAFSSEIKPLLSLKNNLEINQNLISFFIIYGNRMDGEETYIKTIQSLKASYYLIYQNRNLITKRYYDIKKLDHSGKNEARLEEELSSLLYDSIKLRFRSDVPVGTCLSGGFDSSSIVSFSSKVSNNTLNTFSAVWKDNRCDESKYIDVVNSQFNSVENKIEPKADEFEKVFDTLCYYQEIPTEGPGLIPQWYVMKKAKEKVKVLLDGQGGDEVFGGYFLRKAYLRSLLKDKKIKSILSEIKLFSLLINKTEIHSLSSLLFPRFYNKIVREFILDSYNVLNKEVLSNINKNNLHYDAEPPKKFKNYLNNLSYHFINRLTIPALLHYEDRSSMAHSIESRVPFLDYRLVEFGVSLPPKYLVNKNTSRPLFRKALGKYLPSEIVNRKDKLGYPTPFADWTRNSLKPLVTETLLSKNSNLADYVNLRYIEKKLQNHFEKKIDYSWEIWRLLSLSKFLININSLKNVLC